MFIETIIRGFCFFMRQRDMDIGFMSVCLSATRWQCVKTSDRTITRRHTNIHANQEVFSRDRGGKRIDVPYGQSAGRGIPFFQGVRGMHWKFSTFRSEMSEATYYCWMLRAVKN